MSTGAWLIVCGGATLLGVWVGMTVGYLAHRQQTQDRGTGALVTLEGMSSGDILRPPPNEVVPLIPAARLLARATDLPDPYPFTRQDDQ